MKSFLLESLNFNLKIAFSYNYRFLRNLPFFKERFSNKKKYEVWADTGTHFRCSEFLHYLFNELSNEKIKVSFNLFGEQHGKSARDQHFFKSF